MLLTKFLLWWCLMMQSIIIVIAAHLCVVCGHHAQVCEIVFVANQHHNNVLICMLLELLEPSQHIVKRRCSQTCEVVVCKQHRVPTFFGDVVYKERAQCSSIVGTGDCPVPLLACCVPDLGFDGFAVNLCGDTSPSV